jgi:hypothetical protein
MPISIDDTKNPGLDERLRTVIGLSTVDKDFRARLIREPKVVFEEIGVTVPEGWNLIVVESPPQTFTLTIPAFPSES